MEKLNLARANFSLWHDSFFPVAFISDSSIMLMLIQSELADYNSNNPDITQITINKALLT